jgi:hypothetical protein
MTTAGLCFAISVKRWQVMTDIHTILLSELNRTLTGSELAKDIDDALIERIRVAKRAYQGIPHGQLRFDVEEKRTQLLNEISMLQSETFFKVGHSATLSRMIRAPPPTRRAASRT